MIMSAFVCNAVDLCDTWHKKTRFIVSFTVQFACLCDNDVCMSNAGVVVSGFEEQILGIELCECVAG